LSLCLIASDLAEWRFGLESK
jgi:photosystem II PsbT protein